MRKRARWDIFLLFGIYGIFGLCSALGLVMSVPSCAHVPSPPPTVTDAGPPYQAACANLAAIGCSDGLDPTCAAILEQMTVGRIIKDSTACLATAPDVAAAIKCGGVSCK